MKEAVDCIDAGTEFCPCHLAESNECILCSQLQGSCFCDCLNWNGVCIYHEFINNGSKAKEGRKTYNCLVEKKVLYQNDVLLIKFKAPHKLAIDLVRPGSFIFIRTNENVYFDVPISILESNIETNIITIMIEIRGIKTKKLLDIKEGGENIPTEDGYNITASQLAERFLFDGTMQYTPIEKLSGGERRRLHLLRVLMESPNVLILDEPTNDLDIETLKILEDFLDEFIGVVIIVSHDRYFLDRLCNKIFSYEGDGLVKQYVGNYSDYLIHKEYEIKPEKSKNEVKEKKTNQKENRNTSSKPKFTFKEQKEFEEIYSVIESLEHELTVIEDKMAKNASNYGALNELMKEKETLEEELLFKYERLEYLEDIANKIEEYKSR